MEKHARRFLIATLAVTAILIAATIVLPKPLAEVIVSDEECLVESLSGVFWWLAVIAMIFASIKRGGGGWSAAYVVVLAAAGFREEHLRREILSSDLNPMKPLFWISEQTPLAEKFLVAAVFIALIASIIKLLIVDSRLLFAGLRKFNWTAIAVFIALSFLGVAQFLDDGEDILGFFGLENNARAAYIFVVFEETMEFCAAAIIFEMTLLHFLRRYSLIAP